MRFFNRILISSTFLAGALASCVHSPEPIEEEPPLAQQKVQATITVSMPARTDDNVETRAGVTDTDILTCDGLIFDQNGKFLERTPAASIVEEADGIHITLLFDAVNAQRRIHLVANARDFDTNEDRLDFSILTEGCAESQVGLLKTKELDADRNTQDQIPPCIMWGRLVIPNITVNTNFSSKVNLLRATACVTAKTAAATADNGLSDFELEGISACNMATTGYLTPTTTVTTAPTAAPAVTAGRPVGGNILTDASKSFVYDAAPSIYMYDRNCSTSDYMGVIIKGKYKGESGYYKVLMLNGNTPYNIVRNHRYILTVTSVSARGYADLETAVNSRPANTLQVSLIDQDPLYSSVTGDSQYTMSLDCNTFELFGKYASTNDVPAIRMATVKSTREVTPTFVYDRSQPWISNVRAAALGNNTYAIIADFTADNADHELDITVRSDNLELPMKVKWHANDVAQTSGSLYSVKLINEGEQDWEVSIVDGQTSPAWFGMTNSEAPRALSGAGFVTYISSVFDPGAWLHISAGSNNVARLTKRCGSATNTPISANMTVIRHQ